MKQSSFKIIMLLLLLLIAGCFITLYNINSIKISDSLTNANSQGHDSHEAVADDYGLSVTISKSWENADGSIGAQYDGLIYNNTSDDCHGWSLVIDVPEGSYVDSCWDGIFKIEGSRLYVSNEEYNDTIQGRNKCKFGMVMYTPGAYEIDGALLKTTSYFNYKTSVYFYILIGVSVIWVAVLVSHIVVQLSVKAYRQRQQRDREIITQSITTFTNFVDAKDPYTRGHSSRVALYSREIARRMGISEEEREKLYYIALMHDAGKIGIPDAILNKKGALTPDERKIIENHTLIGGNMLQSFTSIDGIIEGALYHHERFDGKGYPKGIAGKDIPLYARIICIADSYDAMSSNRCYRKHLERDVVLSELRDNSGTQFDPDIVLHMIDMINDGFVDTIVKNVSDND